MKGLKDSEVIKKIARELGLKRFKDPEKAIREFCVRKVEKIIAPFTEIKNLDALLEIVSSGLGIRFEEVNDDGDISDLAETYAPQGELIFADLARHLDEMTDAVLISLKKTRMWKYVAVIDCRGFKKTRAYFSKWHEVAHVLTESPQPALFRRTPKDSKAPEETLADRIAGDFAFYTPLFLPELLARTKLTKRLTFDIIEELRKAVCPAASREATIRGAISRAPFPQVLVIADYALKKEEERTVSSLQQMDLFPENGIPFEPKLRAVQVVSNLPAKQSGLQIHRNMEIPEKSVITDAYWNVSCGPGTHENSENLNWWKHSRGALPNADIEVEAMRIGKRVFALISWSG